jgi:hypothetical protein
VLYNGTVRNDGVLEKRFEQRFPLDLALYKNPLLLLPVFLQGAKNFVIHSVFNILMRC